MSLHKLISTDSSKTMLVTYVISNKTSCAYSSFYKQAKEKAAKRKEEKEKVKAGK